VEVVCVGGDDDILSPEVSFGKEGDVAVGGVVEGRGGCGTGTPVVAVGAGH